MRDTPPEELFSKVFALSPSPMALTRFDDGRILDVNPAWEATFGYRREEALGRTTPDLGFWPSPESRTAAAARLSQGGSIRDMEQVVRRRDGTSLNLHWWAETLTVAGERLILVTWLDLTARTRSEEELRDSRDRYQSLIETTGDFIWEMDTQGRYTFCSPQMEVLWGLGPEQMLGKTPFEMMPPDRGAAAAELFADLVKSRKPFHGLEASSYDGRGRLIWIEVSGVPFFDRAGELLGYRGTTRDVTARREAAEALSRSEALLRAVTDNSPDAIYVKDRQSRWLMANPAVLRIVDRTAEQALGRTDQELYDDPQIGRAILENDRRILERGEPEAFEEIADTPEGRRVFLSQKAPWRDAEGAILGLIGISHDITERKVTEARAAHDSAHEGTKAERQRFLGVLETLPVMVTLLSSDRRITWANCAFRAAFGDHVGELCHLSLFGQQEPCAECQSFVPLETGQPHHWEWTLPTGRIFDIHDFPFADADGSPMILEMDLDVTEARRGEAALRRAHDQLATRAAQLRALAGELAVTEQRERRRMAKVLHDHLQQMLVGAKFRLTVLGRHVDPVVQQAAAEVEGLLDESIRASRSLTAELSPPILQEAGLIEGLRWLARWMADNHGLFVVLDLEEGCPPLSDDVKVLLFESVRELLFNAAKHSGTRSAGVHLRAVGERIDLVVSDEGVGFDPQALPRAGEEGGGYGLFSIRERLEYVGGRLDIDSAPGRGSRFVLSAPAGPAEAPPAEVEAHANGAPVLPGLTPVVGEKIRVLLVDDHEVMREGLARLLGLEPDLEVIGQAADGQEAVEASLRLQPDVILMDVSMPRLNGVEATRAIHNDYPEIRIIGLSMFEEAEQAQAMRDAGAVDYLAKSGPALGLVTAIRASIRGRRPA